MNKMVKFVPMVIIFLGLTGCRVGPSCCVPEVEIADNWHVEAEGVLTHSNPLDLGELFDDSLLKQYLCQIASKNNDVKLAFAKINEAYALRQMSSGKLFPALDGRIAYNRSDPAGGILTTGDTADPSGGSQLAGIPLNLSQQVFIADFDALWELDVFGKRRREVESTTAYFKMQIASYHDTLLSLMAEFARTYLELRRSQNLLSRVNQQILLLERKQQLIQQRLGEGLDSQLQFLMLETSLEQLLSETPIYEGEILALMYRLSVLLGENPETLVAELSENREIPAISDTVPIGFPSELLRRRPDIRYAEEEIAQATADVGVAVADLFPRITLIGNFGYETLMLGKAKGEGESWGFGGSLLTPLLRGGSLRANVRRNKWIRQESLINYEQTVLRALEESESAIAKFLNANKALQAQINVVESADKLQTHAERRYKSGLVNRLELVDSKINYSQHEMGRIIKEVDSKIQLIALYKALGGSLY